MNRPEVGATLRPKTGVIAQTDVTGVTSSNSEPGIQFLAEPFYQNLEATCCANEFACLARTPVNVRNPGVYCAQLTCVTADTGWSKG
jgi:hypothetical protein